jgi:hypothetical protein
MAIPGVPGNDAERKKIRDLPERQSGIGGGEPARSLSRRLRRIYPGDFSAAEPAAFCGGGSVRTCSYFIWDGTLVVIAAMVTITAATVPERDHDAPSQRACRQNGDQDCKKALFHYYLSRVNNAPTVYFNFLRQ